MANRFCGCFVWALAPFCLLFLVWPFASLFPLAKRKSGWGVCGLVGCWVFLVCCFNRFAVSMDYLSLYKCLSCLFSCKDRAFSATSATLEEKKNLELLACLVEQFGGGIDFTGSDLTQGQLSD